MRLKPRLILLSILLVLVPAAAWIRSGIIADPVLPRQEAVLKSDLKLLREAIDQYTLDKKAAPQSLEDLTNPQSQYLREIPVDPMTRQKDWQVEMGDTVLSLDQTRMGILNVHSNSNDVSPFDGSAYNTW